MKKLFLFAMTLILSISVMAQQKIQMRSADKAECVKSDMRSLKASFSFSTIEAEDYESERGTFSWLSLPNTVIGGNEGDPQIPVVNELIAVPFGATPRIEITSYSSTDYDLADYDMKTLVPRQLPVRKDQKPEDVPFIMNEAAYQARGFRSEPMAVVNVVGTMRGVQLGKMTIEPVSYDPVNNKIRVFNNIEATVYFDGADAKATEDMLLDTYSPYFNGIYGMLFNGRAVRSAYDDHPDLYTTPVKMLVVTTSTYTSSTPFQNWLTWKKQKGFDVDVQTVTSSTSSSDVRSLIQSRYNANHPTFLVIVGDETAVKNYTTWTSSSLSYSPYISDNAYASIDNDVYHDMFMSRMSVSNTTELGYLVDKILMYEKYTMPDPSYLNNVLLIAGADGTWAPKVGRPTINYAANNYYNSAHGFSNVYKYVTDSYTGCYNYLSSGVGFANYTAHGDIQEWYSPNFTNTNVNSLTNTNKYFWAMGNCCLTANWGNSTYYPCYGEAMIRAQNKGAFGYIGSIPESYWWEDYYFGVGATSVYSQTPSMSETTTGVYDFMFDDTQMNTLNSVPFAGNVAVTYAHAGSYSYSVSDEYYWRGYQCLGDGSVMPYHVAPAANSVSHDNSIVAGTNSFRVNADAGSYVAITVNNNIIGVAAVPANATYVNVPFTTTPVAGTTAMIVVTRNQRQPYINDNVPVINNNAPQYTITANATPTGSGTVEGGGTYYENTQCTLTAVANHGYAFQKWNDNNTDNPRTITVTGNATYTATFRTLQPHHITYNPQMSHGIISVDPVDAIMGDIVTLTATPDPGFALDQWDVNTSSKGNVPVENNQFVMPDEAVTVSATFKVADPLTVADGSGTNSEVPFYGLYADDNYQHTQTIYPSSMLTDMQGMQITKLTYYLSGSVTKNYGSTFEVRLGTTTTNSFSNSSSISYLSDATSLVYSNTLSVSGTTVEFDLNTPYTYTGGNLLVDVRITALGSGYGSASFLGESGETYYSVKNKSTSSVPSTGAGVSFMPRTTFTYEVPQPYIRLTPATATVFTGFTETLTANYGNVSGTPTITYSSSNTSVATVTGNGTTATVTGVAAGTATITATMTVDGTPYTATCDITVEAPSYCTPGTGNVDNDGIYNVTFGTNGTVVNNTVSKIAYGDYSDQVGAVEPGTDDFVVAITYKTGYTYGTIIWVDWDNSYTFEGSEVVYAGQSGESNPTTLEATFDIPLTAPVGNHRMRIIGSDMGLDSYTGSLSAAANADPCGSYNYSTCHDYTLRVEAPTTDPAIRLNPATATVVIGFTQTLTASTLNVTGTPTITYTSSNTNVATVTGNGTSATVTGVSVGTATITATMTYNGADYTATSTITVEEPQYCTPSYSNTSDYIASFSTTGGEENISNASNAQGAGGYSNFYNSHYVSAEPGTTIDFTVTRGYNDSYKYAIWIDWNHDYMFDVNTEAVAQQTSSINSDWSSSFTIPDDADGGDYHMRVEMLYGSSNTLSPCISASYGEVEDYKLTVLSSCLKPTGLVLSDITAHGVTATWDAETGDVFQYAMVVGANINPTTVTTYDGSITASGTTCSMSWNNLLTDADYTLVIRKDCGEEEYSNAIAQSFTTEATCPAPTNVTASNLTQNSARISWEGNADSYNVIYREATITGTTLEQVFFDGFENGLGNWTTYSVGDYTGDLTVWQQYDATNLGSNYNNTNHGGSYVVRSKSYAGSSGGDVTVDNWLVSPKMTLGDVLTFWVSDDGTWHEHLEVWVSTGTNAISDFVKVAVPADAESAWTMRTVDLSAYAGQEGYIAIRNNDTGKDYILVDDFTVSKTINTYSYGTEQILPPTSENYCNLTGLSAETLYEVQVQADCGDTDGTSRVSTIYFTTPDACSAPTDLVSTNITATSATLGWADNQDSYNVQYRKVYFYEDFEAETLPEGWTTIDANDDGNTWGIGFSTSHSGDNGAYNLSYIYNTSGTTPDDYLVSPQLDLQGTLRVWLSGYAFDGARYEEHFEILLSTTGNSASDFTTTLVGETTTSNTYVEYTADLSSYEGRQGYIAIHHFNCTDQNYLYVDDFGLYGTEDWVSVDPNPTEATTTLTGLSMNTTYEWQVQGLDCNNEGSATEWSQVATFTVPECYVKHIDPYTTKGGYYLIASPIGEVNPTEVANMISNSYDLYRFNQAADDEWENWKQTGDHYHFDLEAGKGYLYANSGNEGQGIDLVFYGSANTDINEVTLALETGVDCEGMNLVGNPFAEEAYIEDGRDFYRMNDTGDDIMTDASTGKINPMEGVFVNAESDGETLTFTTEPVNQGSKAMLAINLSQNRSTIDRAIVRFGEGRQLPKFQIHENSTKLSFQKDDKDYAVIRSMSAGEMPLNFKAKTDGFYTLSIDIDEVEFSYLHLIDHLTGNDVDLLGRGSYSFDATATDDESRFTLVFRTASTDPDLTQNTNVTAGWSWWSTYIEMIGVNGIELLENALGDNGIQIKTQQGFASNSSYGWAGNLNSLNNESMYLVKTHHADEIAITGAVANPTDHTIHINSGWNWIGYVKNQSMNVDEALANLTPSDEDIIKSHNSFTTYYEGYGWFGDLAAFEPGQGYMVKSTTNTWFTYPSNDRVTIVNKTQRSSDLFWNPVIGKFPTNMSIMAVIEDNGNELRTEDVELAAFDANGECRGSAKLLYVEPIDRYVAYLTVLGNENESLHFMARIDGQSYTVSETLTMNVDKVVGTGRDPFKMTLKGAGLDENNANIRIFPNPTTKGQEIHIELPETLKEVTVEVYDALGRLLYANELSTSNFQLPTSNFLSGVYTLRLITNNGVKTQKVVIE